MFSVKQVRPLLLAAYRKLSEHDFCNLLKAISIISFRYNVIANNPTNEQERVYTTVAQRIEKENLGLTAILTALKPLYPSDDDFKGAFSKKALKTSQARNKKIVRYLLFKIEEHASGKSYDRDSDRYSIEHIMPERLGDAWEEVADVDHEQFVFRLGNMTLLPKNQNRAIGNKAYADKRPVYEQSEFNITQRIATESSFWDMSRIQGHQDWMANQATAIWRIAQLQ